MNRWRLMLLLFRRGLEAVVFLAFLAAVQTTVCAANSAQFNNGAISDHVKWLDTSGKLINAHDGGILFAEGKYHWYGMVLQPLPVLSRTNGGQKTMVGVAMYSSSDLYNWTDEGVILGCSTNPSSPLCGPMRFERPKIVYNEATKKYVMWFHYVGRPGDHGNKPGFGEAGVASCSTVNGKYTFHGCTRPIDTNGIVRDCTLFKDDDGSAYFIYDRDVRVQGPDFGRVLHVVKLTPDYLGSTTTFCKITNAAAREAPVMLKRKGAYYLITSGMTGWKFNEANYYRAASILGSYVELGDPCVGPGKETTFDSQGTYAFAVEGKKDAFVVMFERHNTACMTDSSYIFLPLNFPTASTLKIEYLPRWNLGYWGNGVRN